MIATSRVRIAVGLLCLAPGMAAAQTLTPPSVAPSLILPNYNRVLVGDQEALEGGAFTARADGAVAIFYNPAGLGLSTASKITAGLSTQEWMQYAIEGSAVSTARTANRSIGGVFGVVIGPEIARLEKWRFGFLAMRPVSFQPELELRASQGVPGGTLGTTYITTSRLSDFAPALAAAYIVSPTLRVGFSARLSSFSLYQNQTLYFDLLGASSLQTAESTLFSQGSVLSVVGSGGIQWDATPHVRVGAHVVLPSARLTGGASVIYHGSAAGPQGGTLTTFADSDVEFEYRQPFIVAAGAAWTYGRGSVEFDVKHYAGTGPYEAFTTGQMMQRTITTAAGSTTDALPLPSTTYQARAVTNVAVGGKYRFSNALTAHAGYYTDRSPVETGPPALFASMNLSGVTAGAAISISRLTGSAGLAFITGRDPIEVPSLGGTLTPQLRVRSVQLFYAISVTF
jgi:hypothetical protein